MNYHPKHKSNSRTAVWIGAGVLAAVAIGAIIFISITLHTPMTKEEARAKAGIIYDSSATEGGWDNLSPEEIEARLNEKVAEGMINISANTAPIFEDGSSEGNLMLVNESINNYPQKVQIVRNDTGEQIYESGASGGTLRNVPPLLSHRSLAGFMNTFDDLLGKSGKWPYYHYHFEIRGLCELEFDGKLYCSILGSLDDLDVELEILTINYWDCVYDLLQNKDEGIAKTGFASFDGKSYIFTIRVNSSEASWELYDENLRAYSLEFHSFSEQWPTAGYAEHVVPI